MGRRRNRTILAASLFLALIPAGGFALHTDPGQVEVGDTGTFFVPWQNYAGSQSPIKNARIVLSSVPSWIDIEPTSFLGVVDISSGEIVTFYVDFTINSTFDPASPNADISINLVSDSPEFVPSNLTWHFTTANGFRTAKGESSDDEGIVHAQYHSPDMLAPVTYLNYGELSDLPGDIFLSTQTLLYFEGVDSYVVDAEISGVSLTGHRIDSSPESFDTLDFSTEPVLLSEGQHVLYFASKDYAGNTEVIKSSTVFVDGTAPVTNFQIIGSSVTDADGNLVISTDAYIILDGNDNGVPASGLNRIMYSVDDSEYIIYFSSFTLPEGHHKIIFFGVDGVDNQENPHTLELFVGAVPQTRIWSGLAGDGDWYNPANWRDNTVPGINDTAIVATRDTVLVGANSPVLRIHDLVLGDSEGLSAPVLLVSTGVASSGTWSLHKNATLTQNTTQQIIVGSIVIYPGAILNHTANTNMNIRRYIINLKALNNFTLMAGSSITVDGLGYSGGGVGFGRGYGPGTSWYDSSRSAGGAGHGGQGENGSYANAIGGVAYDSLTNPEDLGSGGASGDYTSIGGNGGGAVILVAG